METEITSSSKQKPAGDRGRCPLNVPNDQVGRSVSGFFAYVAAKYKKNIQRNLLEKDIFHRSILLTGPNFHSQEEDFCSGAVLWRYD